MTRRALALAALALATGLSVLIGGCSRKAPEPTQFTVGIDADPERLDPLTMKNPKNFIVSWQIYEGLLGLDNAGRIAPAIAERWDTSDNVTWRFHIRNGVSFHASDMFGTPARPRSVTAKDVVASYTAFCSATAYPAFLLTDSIKGCAEFNSGKAQVVEGVRALDDSIVEITLTKAEPFFLNRLTTAWIAIFPREALDAKYRDAWGLGIAVGTGPFRLVSRNDNEVLLERNPDYWDKSKSPAIGKLAFRIVKNDQVRLAELNKGAIDMMLVPPPMFPAVLEPSGELKPEYSKKFHGKTFSTYNSHMIGINMNLVPDVHLRRAMSYGVDRAQIVRKLLYGRGDATVGTIPPGINGYVAPFDASAFFSPTIAKEELAKSSYKGAPIEVLIHEQAASEQIGQLFQDQMKAIGINITLTKLDFNSVIGRMVKGDAAMFSMYLDYVFSSPEPILLNLFTSSKRPVPNFWQFSDAAIDGDIESLRQLKGESAVKKSADIEQRIIQQAPAIFLFRLQAEALYSNRFDSLPINPHGHFNFAAMKLHQPK